VLDVEVLGSEPAEGLGGEPNDGLAGPTAALPSRSEIERLCARALASMGIEDGHVAVEFVNAERIADLNEEYRGKQGPTDVLSFPIDGVEPLGGTASLGDTTQTAGVPRELGDIVICPEHTADLREAIVHGALHLLGMDHEADDGEMLALQAELLRSA
jgi:probable rRNA maturation factor